MDINKMKAIVLYVLNKTSDKTIGKHELFKILYFASQKRLVKYGRAMITDFYALQYGPVPMELYDYLKDENNAKKLLYKDEIDMLESFDEKQDIKQKISMEINDDGIYSGLVQNNTKKKSISIWIISSFFGGGILTVCLLFYVIKRLKHR